MGLRHPLHPLRPTRKSRGISLKEIGRQSPHQSSLPPTSLTVWSVRPGGSDPRTGSTSKGRRAYETKYGPDRVPPTVFDFSMYRSFGSVLRPVTESTRLRDSNLPRLSRLTLALNQKTKIEDNGRPFICFLHGISPVYLLSY